MKQKETILVFAAHSDDEIIGCGATIAKFSEEGKIPIKHGIHRIVVGKLIFSAIVSEIVSTKFIIRKIHYIHFNVKSVP